MQEKARMTTVLPRGTMSSESGPRAEPQSSVGLYVTSDTAYGIQIASTKEEQSPDRQYENEGHILRHLNGVPEFPDIIHHDCPGT
jgi:hypothetical protein